MVEFRFSCEQSKWNDWKDTVPRSKTLEQRILELIEADTDGRVQQPPVDTTADDGPAPVVEHESPPDKTADVIERAREDFVDDPDQRPEARVDSLRAAIAAVADEPLSKSELQKRVYPEIEVDIQQNERTWFRKTVKPYLKDVAEYSNSDQKWHYSG